MMGRIQWLTCAVLAIGVAALAGCGDQKRPMAIEERPSGLEAVESRVEELDARLAEMRSLATRVDAVEASTADRIALVEKRLDELTEESLDAHDEAIERILRLRDHVTLQFGRIRKESERNRIQELANANLTNLKKLLAEGGIVLDEVEKTFRLKGTINLTEGLVEFLAVGVGGKDHESLLMFDCVPSLLNAALLALGLQGGQPFAIRPKGPDAPDGGIPYGPEDGLLYYPPRGPAVLVYVEWQDGENKIRRRAEDLLLNRLTGKSMKPAGWVYIGSRFASDPGTGEELYVADVTKDMISVWHSYMGNAILDNPLPEGMDDDVFIPNREQLPERGTPVEVIFSVEPLEGR